MNEKLPRSLIRTVIKWLWRTAVALLAISFLLGFGLFPFQFAGLLLFGWIAYLGRVIPEITFNAEIACDGALALALALFGLHRIFSRWIKLGGNESVKWRFGWTLKITIMVLLLFATSIASVGMIHQIGWLFHEPVVVEFSGMSKQTRELSNVKQVAFAGRTFASDHDGRFPNTLDDLFPNYLSTHKLLFTVALNDDPPQPIIYYPGYSIRDDARTIIVASSRLWESPRGRERIVAYLDDSARIIPESEFEEIIQKQHPPAR